MDNFISTIPEFPYALDLLDRSPAEGVAAPPQSSCYDAELLAEIEHIGFHPFILVRAITANSLAPSLIACRTQNDAGQFVHALSQVPHLAESKLVRAIERALQLEIYEAADLLFSWTQEQAGRMTETAFVGMPDGAELNLFYGYPAFELTNAPSVGNI